jgi:hypothetical protein
MIRCKGVWNTKAGNPSGSEGMSTGGGGRGGKRNGFSPAGGAVNHCEDVSVTLGGREGSKEIYMDVGETSGRKRNGSWRRRYVCVNFLFFSGHALPGPSVEIPSHVCPDKA